MRQAFEKAAQVYEGVKKSVQEKWDGFKKKFEGTKSEMSQEVMSAKSPDDLIALGKKLQEQGEALKVEEQGVKQEEAGESEKYETGKKEMMDADYEEGHEMNKAFDENKAAEEAAKEKIRIAEEDRLKAEDEAAKLAEIRAKINGGGVEAATKPVDLENIKPVATENVEPANKEAVQEKFEDEYGVSAEEAKQLLASQGYPEKQIQANDPQFREKMEEFHNNQKAFGRVRVKLFDKVLSGEASESEIKMAEEHAASAAKGWSLEAFNGGIPKAWYTNERIANALASTSENNKKWVEKVRKTYTEEQLKKGGFEKIDERGFKATYNIKGF